MTLPNHIPTLIVGAGHAGLTMSNLLTRAGRDHLVVDRRPSLGGGWQDRWDAFRLVTPNWITSTLGQRYDGTDPDGFMPRDEIVRRVADFATLISAPVALETEVLRVTPRDGWCLPGRDERWGAGGGPGRRCDRQLPHPTRPSHGGRPATEHPAAPRPRVPQ